MEYKLLLSCALTVFLLPFVESSTSSSTEMPSTETSEMMPTNDTTSGAIDTTGMNGSESSPPISTPPPDMSTDDLNNTAPPDQMTSTGPPSPAPSMSPATPPGMPSSAPMNMSSGPPPSMPPSTPSSMPPGTPPSIPPSSPPSMLSSGSPVMGPSAAIEGSTAGGTDAASAITMMTQDITAADNSSSGAGDVNSTPDPAMTPLKCLQCDGDFSACGKKFSADTPTIETCTDPGFGCVVKSSKSTGVKLYSRGCHNTTCTSTTKTCSASEECSQCCSTDKCNSNDFSGAIRVTSYLTWLPLVSLLALVVPKML